MKKPFTPADLQRLLTLDPGSIGSSSYEAAMENLELVVEALEQEGTPLDVGLKLYELGNTLSRRCTQVLDSTEARMVQILGEGGQTREVPFDPEKDGR